MANTRLRAQTIRDKFPHVKVESGPVAYVIEFSNGVVKLGYTANARARLYKIATSARRIFGELSVARVHVRDRLDAYDGRRIEWSSLHSASSECKPVDGSNEFFKGLTFERAVELVTAAVAQHEHGKRQAEYWRLKRAQGAA